MNYPEPDSTIIDAATRGYEAAVQAATVTETAIGPARAALAVALAERERAIDRAVNGEDVTANTHRKIEAKVRHAEDDVARLRAVLAAQEGRRLNAENGKRAARGKAERHRVIIAIREIFEAGIEVANARRALSDAIERDHVARNVMTEAFGHGFPVPVNFPPGAMPLAEMERALGGPSASSLRTVWREMADEALPAAAA